MTKEDQRNYAIAAGGAGALFLLWRRHKAKQAAVAQQGPAVTNAYGGLGSVQPYTPQEPIPLQPGESIYDPNTVGLYNTPTAISAGGSLIGQTGGPSQPGYVVNVNYPGSVHKTATTVKPAKRKPNTKYGPTLKAAPFGKKKPVAPSGYHTVGLGGGYWGFAKNAAAKEDTKAGKDVGKDAAEGGKGG
jgi:hypothetical protein